jgi:regulation of enolase protein 1 (concanavalin A-like superfamily)
MPVSANTDLSTLTVAQINELISDAGEAIEVDTAQFIQLNASDEYQYEVTYYSVVTDSEVTNHVFVDIDIDGDVRLELNDLDPEDDLFAD